MQDKINKEFDSFVRSMLENAQEQAPEGIWEAIESRLPQPRRATAAWWRWAGIGLATAAAALGVIFLTGRTDKVVPASPAVPAVVAEATHNDLPVLTETDVPEYDDERVATYLAKAEPADEPQPQEVVPVKEEVSTEIGPVAAPAADEVGTVNEEIEEYTVNPFAALDGPSHKKARTQIQVDGLVGSNDGTQIPLFSNRIIMGAPTTSSISSPISEISESSYSIPVTFGLGFRVYLNDKFSLGTGVNFSLLSRVFDGSYMGGPSCEIGHELKYIGIPVNIYCDLLNSDRIKVYSFAGGAAEKAFSNNFVIKSGSEPITYSEKVNGLQWSANLGLGVQFNLSNNIGLFLDPSARYYFDCNQPKSIRTKNRFMFGFEAGLRFDL